MRKETRLSTFFDIGSTHPLLQRIWVTEVLRDLLGRHTRLTVPRDAHMWGLGAMPSFQTALSGHAKSEATCMQRTRFRTDAHHRRNLASR